MVEYWKRMRDLAGHQPLILAGANVVLLDKDNRILLHHRSDMDLWGLPGGFCELAETVEDTARREVLEEIGIQCGELELLNVYSGAQFYFKYPNGDEVYNVTVSYLCRDYSGAITVNPQEGRDARFFALDELPINIARGIRLILEDLKARRPFE